MVDELRELHRRALASAGEYVRHVTAEDLGRSTPCTGWTLAELLAHMVGQHRGFAAAARDGDAPYAAYAPMPFTVEAWDASAAELLAAFAAADPAASSVLIEIAPQPLPMTRVLSAQLLDTAVHTWDVAQSLGLPYEPPDDIADVVVTVALGIPDGARRSQAGAAFAPAIRQNGTPWERALAHLGRDPVTTSHGGRP